jgi:hypothetical protein
VTTADKCGQAISREGQLITAPGTGILPDIMVESSPFKRYAEV